MLSGRGWKGNFSRSAWALGLMLATAASFSTQALAAGAATPPGAPVLVPAQEVLSAVQAAERLQVVPAGLRPALSDGSNWASAGGADTICNTKVNDRAGIPFYAFGGCTYGDLSSNKLMVVYGDSHAGMWGEALQAIALKAGWKLVTFDLPNCPAPDINYLSWANNKPETQCDEFHVIGPETIDRLHPQLVILTSDAEPQQVTKGVLVTASQWEAGWLRTIGTFRRKGTTIMMIGDIPQWSTDTSACLEQHKTSVQDCAALPGEALAANVSAERAAAAAAHVRYISPVPWICANQCEPIIAGIRVYNDEWNLTGDYASYLGGALGQALGLLAPAVR